MPTSTDLVTDLPADFEVFGQAVDTSLADLKGGTTGQILAKNSNTNMDFVWITNDIGDITAVTAGTGISGGGSSGAVTITNSMATEIAAKGDLIVGTGSQTFDNLTAGSNGDTLVADSSTTTGLKYQAPTVNTVIDAKGDLLAGTADNTIARRSIGANGTVLTADSAESTGMKWATPAAGGGMTAIASGSLSGSAVNLTSISQSYKNLQLVVRDFYPATNTNSLVLRLMNDSGANQYVRLLGRSTNATWSVGSGDRWYIDDGVSGNLNSQSANQYIIDIPDYADAATMKNVNIKFGFKDSSSVFQDGIIFGLYKATGAINEINLLLSGGNFGGGTYVLYGVQ